MTQQEFEKIKGKRIAILNKCGIFRIESLYEETLIVTDVNTGSSQTLGVEKINTCFFIEEDFISTNLRKDDIVVWVYNGERHLLTDPQIGMVGLVEDIRKYDGTWTPVDIVFYNPVETHIYTVTHYYGTAFEKAIRYDELFEQKEN